MIIDALRKMVQWNTDEKRPFINELRSNPTIYRDHPLITEKIYLISKHYTEEDYVELIFKIEFMTGPRNRGTGKI